MNKCIKVTIKNCEELEQKELNKKLKDLQYQTCKASNRIIQLCYMREIERANYKKVNGKYPEDKDEFGMSYRNVLYHAVKEQMDIANSKNISQTVSIIQNKFKTDLKDILNFRKSLPNFKLDMPIQLANQSFKINQDNKGYIIECGLFNKEQNISRITLNIDKLDSNKKATLNKIISGEYKQGAGSITRDNKNKWYLTINFSFEPQKRSLNKNKTLGVDLGITNVATMQIWNNSIYDWEKLSWKECIISGKELIHFRQKIEARNKEMSIASKCVGDGRIGHGYKTRMKPLKKTRDKIAKFRDTFNHKVSRYIVDMAAKHQCATIQMENLSGFTDGQSESLLKNWSYYDLQNKIEYKAKEEGMEVKFINPYMTSKRCNKCGNIHHENRDCKKNQSKFKCIACGYEENADINAAKNIALPGIDKIIEEMKY